MRKGMKVLLLVLVTMVIALGATTAPELLADSEFFWVDTVEVEGQRYLTAGEVEAMLALTPSTSVWSDLEVLASRVRRHALVEDARVERGLPGTLRVRITEREPVALLGTPILVPVDRDGRALPIDPTRYRLDLPLLEPFRAPWDAGVELTPSQIRLLSREVDRLAEVDPGLLATASELAVDSWGDVLMHLGDPRVTMRYRPPVSGARLREGLRVLEDALERSAEGPPHVVDLRYEDQVVIRFDTPNGSR